jgi:hypothetical protein
MEEAITLRNAGQREVRVRDVAFGFRKRLAYAFEEAH